MQHKRGARKPHSHLYSRFWFSMSTNCVELLYFDISIIEMLEFCIECSELQKFQNCALGSVYITYIVSSRLTSSNLTSCHLN